LAHAVPVQPTAEPVTSLVVASAIFAPKDISLMLTDCVKNVHSTVKHAMERFAFSVRTASTDSPTEHVVFAKPDIAHNVLAMENRARNV